MSVLHRFKKDPGGFRHLVELLESSPKAKRDAMINAAMHEDSDYIEKAIELMMNFKDILTMADPEIAEIIGETPPQFVGMAIHSATPEIKARFLKLTSGRAVAEVQEALNAPSTPMQIGGAQAKMLEIARKLERAGSIKKKQIPNYYKG